jgi:hypothetical protein
MTNGSLGSAPRQRSQPIGTIDFSMMYFSHDAFKRDLRRLGEAVDAGRAAEQPVTNGWETFKKQLHIHHVGEDVTLWPPLREKTTAPADIAVLDLMEAEHGRIDPLLASIDATLATGAGGGAELGREVKELTDSLVAHMEHEEERALTLVETYLGPAGWDAYTAYMRKTNGLKGGGAYLAWLLDDAPESSVTHVLGLLPAPVRVLYRRVFQPRYARTPRWSTPAV